MSTSRYDAIIVGAGINGLAAAVHLTSKGWRTLVLEKSDVPGGAVRTGEVTIPGFRHDLFAMNLSMFAGSAFYARHKQALDSHGLKLIAVSKSFASAYPDGTHLGVDTDLERTVAAIARFSPSDAATWRAMSQAFPSEVRYIGGLMGKPMPSLGTLTLLAGAVREKGLGWVRDMIRMLLSSPRSYLDERYESPQVKSLMAAWGLHLDFGPDIAGGAVFPYLESMGNQNFGMAIGEGGADTTVNAMLGAIEAAGGEVMLGADVAEILTAEGAIPGALGRANGVRLKDGRRFFARRAIIANLHPRLLAGTLARGIMPSQFSRQAKNFRPGPGAMMIHLALDSLPDWTAGKELQQFAYVHLAPSYDVMSRVYQQAMSGLLPQEPVLVVGQPTAFDPGRAPDGKHVLWVQVRVVPYAIAGDAAGTIASTHWDDAREPYCERVIDLLERYAPGLRGKILGKAGFSPLDLERMNPNLVEGDSLGGSHHLDQNFLFRPFAGSSRWKTPIQNLYMVGAATWPGAGTGAGSGFMLAKQLAGA